LCCKPRKVVRDMPVGLLVVRMRATVAEIADGRMLRNSGT
jgi:hypothetical protein